MNTLLLLLLSLFAGNSLIGWIDKSVWRSNDPIDPSIDRLLFSFCFVLLQFVVLCCGVVTRNKASYSVWVSPARSLELLGRSLSHAVALSRN